MQVSASNACLAHQQLQQENYSFAEVSLTGGPSSSIFTSGAVPVAAYGRHDSNTSSSNAIAALLRVARDGWQHMSMCMVLEALQLQAANVYEVDLMYEHTA